MSEKKKSVITETYTLPSKGKLYGPEFPSEIVIRSMTTFEEKMRLGNQGFWRIMCDLLNAVCSFPEGFSAENLTLFDFYFLMYKMRTVSYGPEYKVKISCPKCGKSMTSKVNLDNLKTLEIPDDFIEPFKIGPLPRSKDTLLCKVVRVKDIINNERKAKDILKKYPEYKGDPLYILNKISEIVSVNDEEMSPYDIEKYVEEMAAMDSAYFEQAYSHKMNNIGLTTSCEDVCESCGEELVFELPFNSEFFRPTFEF